MPDAQPEFPIEAQATAAHVLEAVAALRAEVIDRLDTLEGTVTDLQETVKDSGLNGHTPLLKAFLEQYAGTYQTRQAWLTVRSDLKHRLRWLLPGKHWVALIFAGALGAVGWQIGAAAFGIHVSLP